MKLARSSRGRKGLSLIELLVVVAILAVVAGMVVSMTNGLDSRTRYDDTAKRLSEVRSAILGPDAVSADGQLLSGGFLQDVGRLPADDGELLRAPAALKTWMESHGTNELLQYDTAWKTWYGWRGPYLAAPPKRSADTESRLYDGWGNDFIWPAASSGAGFPVRSLGSDGKAGGTGFEADLPDASQPLIANSEWESPELSGRLQVTVVNLLIDRDFDENVRLRLVVPDFSRSDGPLGCSYASDACVSTGFRLSILRVPNPANGDSPAQNRRVHTFTSNQSSLKVPLGRRMIFLLRESGAPLTDALGNPVEACTELPLSKRLSPFAVTVYIRPRS